MCTSEEKEKFLTIWFFKLLESDPKLNSLYDKNLEDIDNLCEAKKITVKECNALTDNHNEFVFFIINLISECPFIKFDNEFLKFIQTFESEVALDE